MATKIISILSQAHQLAQITSVEFAEEPTGTQSAAALIDLNNILQQMNIDQLLPFSKAVASYTIASSKDMYTIGVDPDVPSNLADIQFERPEFVGNIFFRSNIQANPFRILAVTLEDVRANLVQRSTGIPRYFATNNTYPLAEIYFNIKPAAGAILEIIYNKSIPRYSVNDSLALPLSYNDLLVTALARRLAVNANSELIWRIDSMYKDALLRIKSGNVRNQIPLMHFNHAVDADYGYSRAMSGG